MSDFTTILGDIGNAAYGSPKLNAYGIATKGPFAGQPVDKNGQPVLLVQPGNWYERGFSPLAQQAGQDNLAASVAPIGSQQQLLAQEQEKQNLPSSEVLGNINKASIINQQPISTVATMASQGDFSPTTMQQMYQSASDLSKGVIPASTGQTLANIAANTAIANRTAAQNPASANPGITQNVLRSTLVGDPYAEMNREFTALHPGLDQVGIRMWGLNPSTGQADSEANPTSIYGALMGGAGSMGSTTLPSGGTFQYPQQPPSYGVPPIGSTNPSMIGSPGGNNQGQASIPPTGKLTNIPGTDGYKIDNDGNVFFDGQYVPEENIKGTPLEKVINHMVGFQKSLKDFHATHALPHGLGAIGLNMIKNWYNQPSNDIMTKGIPLIQRGYHALIGE